MGLRESKLCFLPYEEAVKRVTDEEMQRLRLAFKRASGVSGLMVETLFAREVLGDCVPVRVAEQVYTAFGGTTKGINFGNLLCGLVLLTRGTREEKIKFLFNVYTSDGVHVTKESLENAIIASDGGIVSAQVNECFSVIDKLSFDEFAKWLSRNPDVTSLSRWLLIIGNGCSVQLTDSSETPTFYQTLATVTHLHEADIIELEKKYWYLKSTSKTGKFDLEAFTRLVSPPIPSIICPGLFKEFDENCDNHIDFREMACGISACCRGTSLERHQFCFKVFDTDGDGLLSKDEITVMCQTLLEIRRDNNPEKDTNNQFSESDAFLMTEEILANCGKEKDGKISLNEYQQWADDHRFSLFFPKLLVQVCHIVLGLKPASREIELQVAKGWIERENQQGLKPGSVWYLVSMSWWRTWKEHVNYQTMRRSSTGSMKRNGAPPTKTTQVPPTPKTSVNSTWSYDSLKAKTIGRRESHPVFSNKGVSPANGSINGHCIPGNDAVMVGPGQIDNTSLIETENRKIPILTGEGGKLKRTVPLSRGRDFEIIPDPVWKALLLWYGGGPALPRTVIVPKHGDSTPELELFPINLKIFRHAPPPTRGGITTWTGVGFGLSSFGFGNNSMTATHAPPKKYLAFLAAFSRINTLQQVLEYTSGRLRIRVEDLRLWIMEDDNTLTLLEEEAKSLEDLNIIDNMTLLLEVRNRDMSWPEEMSSLASNKSLKEKLNNEPTEKGATGLSNLGNTCFMNSALQCLSNTQPLTQYFTNRCHYYELNRTNPLGMKGHIARRYGDLVEDLWSGSSRSLAPLKLRWTIGRYAPRFNGFQQHDSQEFLSFLLDGLHEDLNRVHNKPYVELKDSDGRPDEIVSQEAWDNHFKRNQSVVVDLFQGQLKSQVRCLQCGYVSARFDPFTFLSLPLPMDNSIYVEIVVVPLSGAVPTKYALLLDNDDKYKAIKKGLSKLCDIKAENLLLVEVYGATVKNIPSDTIKIRSTIAGFLYAYEIPPEQPPTVHKTESQTTSKERTQDVEPAVVQQSSPYICPMNECNELENKNCSQNSSNNSLKVDENWFNDDNKRKKNSGLLKKFSPKIRKKISPKLNGSYSPGRKSSESSESSQSSVSNADSGIALMNGQPTNTVPSVSVTETNPVLPSNTQDCNLNTGGSNAQNCVTNTSFSTNRQNSVTNSGLPSNMSGSLTPTNSSAPCGFTFNGFAVAIHRKMMRQDAYFMSHQKNSPSLFGIPVIVPCTTQTKQSDLYQAVWTQVSRLLSAPPPGDKNAKNGETGEYPFELRAVQKDGLTCSWCPWYRFCRGCPIQCSDQEYGNRSSFLAIEWDPTTLHLRYQSSLEKTFTEHDSVEKSRKLQTEPIDLHECLTAFTKEEELGEDELWYCNKCKKQRLAVKKLEIWSLPPILVIHLKRFQYVNGHWVKSNKIVNYPMAGFDPSAFLVKRSATSPHNSVTTVNVKSNESDERDKSEAAAGSDVKEHSQHDSSDIESITRTPSIRSSSQVDVANRSRHSSTSSINSAKALTDVETHEQRSPVATSGDCCVDQPVGSLRPLHEQSHGCKEVDEIRNRASSMAFNTPTYKLYAMSCHSGVLGGGHYISYSHNPNGRWYCYNDSSCKECDESKMHKDSPYMLFYEQENLQTGKFLPKFKDQTPDTNSDDEEYENDVKRMCTIQ